MSTVVVGIKALLSSGEKFAHLAKKGADLVAAVGSNPSALARFEETSAEATREMLKDSYAAVRALVAHALDRDPSDAEVDAVFADVAEHPNAPFRFHRLLGEARKSTSRRRRRFLASVFFGLPFSKLPDDDRDRVDMTVERMMPADVDLLMRIDELQRTARRPEEVQEPLLFDGTRVAVLVREDTVLIATTDDYRRLPVEEGLQVGFRSHVLQDRRHRPDQVAFGSLSGLGCLRIGESQVNQVAWRLRPLMITWLGTLVIQAIREVGPGFAGGGK